MLTDDLSDHRSDSFDFDAKLLGTLYKHHYTSRDLSHLPDLRYEDQSAQVQSEYVVQPAKD